METKRKVLVGYDLCEDYSQISCYSYKSLEPISICPNNEEDESLIPTVLCIRRDTKLWLYGKEAEDYMKTGDGILVENLLGKVMTGEEVEILGSNYSGISLLEKFLRKSLTLVKNHFPTEPITKLVITVREAHPILVEGIYEALSQLGIEKDRAVVISHPCAYSYYALSQDRSLWINDIGLFDFSEEGVKYYQISINRRIKPMIAAMQKKDYSDTISYDMLKKKNLNLSYIFENIANQAMYKQIISTIYFTGKGFVGSWADDVMKSLCIGRRVFLGSNIYTKGACYAAKELSGDQKLGDFILLTDDMILSSISLKVYSDARMREIVLTEAATPWYEVNKSIEIIPDEETEFEFICRNIMTRDMKKERFMINNLPGRPNRTTRLWIHLSCINNTKIKIAIEDLGFGDLYKKEDSSWDFTFEI